MAPKLRRESVQGTMVFVLGILFHLTQLSFAAEIKITNLHQPFRAFVDQYRTENLEKQWIAWNEFILQYPLEIPPPSCNDCEEKLRQGVREFFELLPQFETRMWHLFSGAEEITRSQVERFRQVFPDLSDNVAVVFVPSMFAFNGQVRTIRDVHTLFIGVDFVAFRNDDLDILFSHEFFHAYHGAKLVQQGKESFQTLASPLWFEGMATWMSIELNPGTSDAEALMDETLALPKFCEVEQNLKSAANDFLKIIDYTKETEGAEAAESNWFKLRGTAEPKRRGYCLGLHVFRRLSKDYKITDLVTLGESEFSGLIKAVLSRL